MESAILLKGIATFLLGLLLNKIVHSNKSLGFLVVCKILAYVM